MASNELLLDERAYDDFIIDCDFHLHIPTKLLYPYVDDSTLRKRLKERGPPPTMSTTLTATRYGIARQVSASHDHKHGTAATSDEIREVCDELAIDVPIVQPGTNLELTRSHYPTLSDALIRAYNDYALDAVIDVDNDVYATLLLPNWDIDLALSELDRLGSEPGFVAAQNWLTTDRLWGDVAFDPVFEKLSDYGLNLILHVVAGEPMGPKIKTESMRTAPESVFIGNAYGLMANIMNMILTGVFDKYPDLKVCFQEAGHLWIPYVAYRLDELYQTLPNDVQFVERMWEEQWEYLDRMPSEYVFENTYTATQPVAFHNIPQTSHVDGLLEACRAGEMFMYTSDWPHPTLDPAEWLYNLPSIDDELRERILHKNAAEMLRLP